VTVFTHGQRSNIGLQGIDDALAELKEIRIDAKKALAAAASR